MFGRIAACGIAAFVLVMPAVSRGDTIVLVGAGVPTVATVIATPERSQAQAPEQSQDQPQVQAPDQIDDQTQDPTQTQASGKGPAQMNVAALDPAQPLGAVPDAAVPASQAPALAQPFGRDVVPVLGGDVWTKWSGVEASIRDEADLFARCRANAELCPPAAQSFLAIVAQGRALSGRARIGVINRAVNMAIIPTSDLAQWGVIDRWSPPLETFATGRGDCEDYAIAKYVALREAGVAAEDVRLIIVRNLAANEDHAVVAARLDGAWIILDNRWLTLVADSDMTDAIPLLVLDDTGVFAFAPTALPAASRAAPASLAY
jgi:predicted transglutaminase-like cysteine proteinase